MYVIIHKPSTDPFEPPPHQCYPHYPHHCYICSHYAKLRGEAWAKETAKKIEEALDKVCPPKRGRTPPRKKCPKCGTKLPPHY